jgi:hypothetical protein
MQDEVRKPTPNVSTSSMSQAQERSPVVADDDLLSPSESIHIDGPSGKGTRDSEEIQQDKPNPPPKPNDPYAMLDSAFGGGYVADQPRPVGGRPGEFDDLLL